MSRQRQLHSTLGQIRLRTGLQPTLRRNGNVHTRFVEEPHCVRALLPSFSNRSRTDSWSFGIVEDPLLHHETQQSVTLQHLPAATLHGRPHGGGRTWHSSSVLSQSSAATLPAVILANRYGMTRCCAQNERVVFTNKLSITSKLTLPILTLLCSPHLRIRRTTADVPTCRLTGLRGRPRRRLSSYRTRNRHRNSHRGSRQLCSCDSTNWKRTMPGSPRD